MAYQQELKHDALLTLTPYGDVFSAAQCIPPPRSLFRIYEANGKSRNNMNGDCVVATNHRRSGLT